jgi:hypothetical protein
MMRDGVRIINCARGGLIDEKALFDALQTGKVAGAAIDVYEIEPATDNILFASNKVICTPHLGPSTREAQANVAMQIAEQISDFLLDGAIVNALNFPSISAEERKMALAARSSQSSPCAILTKLGSGFVVGNGGIPEPVGSEKAEGSSKTSCYDESGQRRHFVSPPADGDRAWRPASQPDISAKAVPDISKNRGRLAQAPRSAMKRILA